MTRDSTVDSFVHDVWDRDILPTLLEYIAIPNISAVFEPRWQELGHMERAVQLLGDWSAARAIDGLDFGVHRLDGRTPVLFAEIPAANGGPADETVFLYGHLDKQPEFTGWREGLGPWTPVMDGDRLYGRGGADDGYATFAALTAIQAAQEAGFPHARCVVLIEASEESGSPDLPFHVEALADRIGTPSLIVCLDSGALDYDRMWMTTSLRGLLAGKLQVRIAGEGVHSGSASGVVPSTFRIARQLLSRLEDETTGEIRPPELYVSIPPHRLEQAAATAAEMPSPLAAGFPFLDGARPVTGDPTEQILNRTWRSQLEITGADGLPPCEQAGNVLRPSTSLYLSLRIPPTADPAAMEAVLERTLLSDPPYGAQVTFDPVKGSTGWNAPELAPWLEQSVRDASIATFGNPARSTGEGGSIPFMGMLGERFPEAQFVVTGVLGPGSNAHGPNEFLHVPTATKLTAVIARVLRDHAQADHAPRSDRLSGRVVAQPGARCEVPSRTKSSSWHSERRLRCAVIGSSTGRRWASAPSGTSSSSTRHRSAPSGSAWSRNVARPRPRGRARTSSARRFGSSISRTLERSAIFRGPTSPTRWWKAEPRRGQSSRPIGCPGRRRASAGRSSGR